MPNKKLSENTKLIMAELDKFPNIPNLTLAKKLYKKHPECFKTLESCRTAIRGIRGQAGDIKRKEQYTDKKYYKSAGDKNPFTLPESHAEHYNPFVISQ